MSIVTELHEETLRPEQELAALIEETSGDGAVVSFTGIARPQSKSTQPVQMLILDHHPVLTEQSLRKIAVSTSERFEVSHIRVVHRCGEVLAGEPIVFAGAASAHRRAAFEAVDYLMDRLKTEAVFWKREIGESGSEWIEPTEDDHAARQRWG